MNGGGKRDILGHNIEGLAGDTLRTLGPLVIAYDYKPYHYFGSFRDEYLADFVLEELDAYLEPRQGNYAYVAREGTKAVGLVALRLLPWDKRIFKKEMATIDYLIAIGSYAEKANILASLLSRVSDTCRALKVEHLSIRVDSADLSCIHALEDAGFRLMDTLVTYCFDFDKSALGARDYPYAIREQAERDIEQVVGLAMLSFRDYIDHFHSDPTLDNQACDELYVEWARNSCLGVVADRVSVAEDDVGVVGFATSKSHRNVSRFTGRKLGEIVLGCVSPKVRGGGVYTSLIHEGLCWFHNKVDFVQVVTQINNTYVQRAWSSLGFRLIGSRSTFHKWYDEVR